ncbi:Hypothetical protein, putative [Bodo saltans]|uniref:Uncharacterized protein n=1 Tax=Bodo saltans TaxID=75058 RepID=A0A0S4JPH3_BODSA|nr:Hypothetical protein, putative [Bodo saltans]|eukprot:CUG92597.1 Hypothetical protein, putative [Bodo saltans]
MPLLEPYKSPSVRRATMRPDPADCPVAGKRSHGRPIPRHVLAASPTKQFNTSTSLSGSQFKQFNTSTSLSGSQFPLTSTFTSDTLLSLKAFNRQKHRPDPDMHFAAGGGKSASNFGASVARASYSAPALPPRQSKFDWNQTIGRGSLSGVGTSVPALDRTNDWMSTRNLEFDRMDRPRTNLVERTHNAVREGRSVAPWASNTTASFSSTMQLASSAKDAVFTRQAFLLSRGQRQPLMSLA